MNPATRLINRGSPDVAIDRPSKAFRPLPTHLKGHSRALTQGDEILLRSPPMPAAIVEP
jgi:hypothetical protein